MDSKEAAESEQICAPREGVKRMRDIGGCSYGKVGARSGVEGLARKAKRWWSTTLQRGQDWGVKVKIPNMSKLSIKASG